jgi:hypothetical protein
MGWHVPDIHRTDPWQREMENRSRGKPAPAGPFWCEQCERVRTETCVACGDEEGLHAA